MRHRLIVLAGAMLAAAPLLAKPAKAPLPAPAIAVGQVLNDTLGKSVNGWLHGQGAMFSRTETKGNVTTASLDCCIAVFSRGHSYIIARTEPLARNPDGGVIREKVATVERIDLRSGEIETECSLFSLQIVFSVRNPKTNQVRSVFVDNGALALLEWHDTANRCAENEG